MVSMTEKEVSFRSEPFSAGSAELGAFGTRGPARGAELGLGRGRMSSFNRALRQTLLGPSNVNQIVGARSNNDFSVGLDSGPP
jgi:hypothetical protein